MFDGTTPNLCTTDVDLIKAVFVKDFDHFINRREFEAKGKYVRKMVSLIKDQEWKDVRSSVTPAFTTGKIKRMSSLIKECADRLAAKFEMIAKTEGKLEHSDPVVPHGRAIAQRIRGTPDNRLIAPKSSYRRSGLAPRCRLVTSWGWRRSQGLGCSPIKVARELGSERRETVRFISAVDARKFERICF